MANKATYQMARFAAGAAYDSLPAEVISHLKLCILDTVGCGLFGSTLPWNRILREALSEIDDMQQASVWGTDARCAMTNACLANGTMVHSFELDDLHKQSILHPGSVVLPPLLAIAQRDGGVTGRMLIEAAAVGYEVGARVGMAVGTPHLLKGFHPTGTIGTFAAAAAAGRLRGLSVDQMVHALGLAGAQSAGLMCAQYAAMAKRLHAGRAAQSGLLAALLAARGFTGAENILEAEYGGFVGTMSDQADFESALGGLGNDFEILNVGFKPYACCGSNHTTIDGLKAIVADNALQPEDIAAVDIQTTNVTYLHVGWPYKPESVTSAQMNLYYCAAVCILDGEVFIDQFIPSRIGAPDVMKFIQKINIARSPELDALGHAKRHSVAVKVSLRDGREYKTSVDRPWGNPHNPMRADDLMRKYKKLAEAVWPTDRVDRTAAQILELENLNDVNRLGI
jgi:2-methylcitrate dehydratase PrpD